MLSGESSNPSQAKLPQRQKIKKTNNSRYDLGASVGCERIKRTFNTPRLKSQMG